MNSSFENAIKAFQSIAAVHPEDHTSAFFLATAKNHLQKGDMENLAGVVKMAAK